MRENWVRSLGWEDPLEKEMATHSSTLPWKIPWTEKPGRLQPLGSLGVTTERLHFHFHPDLNLSFWIELPLKPVPGVGPGQRKPLGMSYFLATVRWRDPIQVKELQESICWEFQKGASLPHPSVRDACSFYVGCGLITSGFTLLPRWGPTMWIKLIHRRPESWEQGIKIFFLKLNSLP